MRLIKFSGKNIRGYLNVNIKFFEDLNFLTGVNGSGKTTVLNLINGLLRPSFQTLIEINYDKIDLYLKNKDKEDIFITSEKNANKIMLRFRYGKNEAIKSEFIIESKRNHYLSYYAEEDNFNNSSVVKQIKLLNGFLYLGVDRYFYGVTKNILDSEMVKNERKKEHVSSLDVPLRKVQDMAFLAIRKANARISTLSEMFKGEILKESFAFVDDVSYGNDYDLSSFSQKLQQQREELNSVIETYKMGNLATSCNSFFSSLENIVKQLSNSNKETSISEERVNLLLQFFVNKSILSKINRIVALGKKNGEDISESQASITRFVQSVNVFLAETSKKISVNQLGEIVVHLPNEIKKTIFELSSGEKHLIIILAYLAFCDESSSVFVVDEPELSLHITWQEIFVDAVQKANPNAQLIFATHSPSIIARKERQKNCIDLVKGY
jgi:predicted ATP-binding protein involved in virulence